jgi:hypothetical protein
MESKEMNWEQIKINFNSDEKSEDLNNYYKFEIGCNVLNFQTKNSLICLNKNFMVENNEKGNNDFFRCDEIFVENGLKLKYARTLFDDLDGPRFRITNVKFY